MELKGYSYPPAKLQVFPPYPGGTGTGVYTIDTSDESSTMYIGDWRVEQSMIWHRHPEENGERREYALNERTCWQCKATCPDSIWFINRLQQLP